MLKDLTELIFIIDKSGSMSGLENDVVNGFNSLIEKQKKESGNAIISTVLFSDRMEIVHNRLDINNVPKLTNKEYFVDGCTALLDALGNIINKIKIMHTNLKVEDKPKKTLFIITTDGMENSSKEYSYLKIKNLINQVKEEYGYEFIFLGANIDSIGEASKLGIDKDKAVSYKCDSKGIELNYTALDYAIKSIRINDKLSKSWRRCIDEYSNAWEPPI